MSSNTKPTVPQAPDLPRDAGAKRKRGRLPNAQRRDALDAPQPIAAAEEYDADADDAGRPRKRGRPLRSVNGGGAAEDGAPAKGAGRTSPRGKENRPLDDKAVAVPASAQDAKRKRGRPALGSREQQRDETTEVPVVNGTARRRTQRKTHEPNGLEEVSKASQPEVDVQRRRRRGGRDRPEEPDPEPGSEPEAEPEPEPEQPARRWRGRPSLQDQRERESVVEQQEEDDQPRLRRRRRPSIQAPPPAEARSQAPKTTAKSADTSVEAASEPAKRGRKDRKPKDSSIEKPTQEQSKSKGRRSGKGATTNPTEKAADDKANNDDDGDGGGGEPAFPEKPYTHIAPHIHRVRQSEIKAKWTPLGESSIASVSSILRLAHRPILQRLSNTQQRREHTAAALRLVANRITHKIARGLPFPPPAMAGRAPPGGATRAADDDGGRAAELDFEGVLDAKQALERQLDPALHAVDLLRREKEKLKRELEKDYEVLRSLDLSARAQARDYRGLVRRAHVLAPAPETAARQNGDHEKDGVVPQRQASSGGLFDSLQDDEEDVKDIGLQLGSHAESIRNNLRQTEGILPQVSRSRAALQDVLFRYLDQEQYEHVLFG